MTGIDLSGPMLDRRPPARARGESVTFFAGRRAGPPLRAAADVAISRFGTMFFDDPVAAFANIARAIRPGGRLCLATWQPLAANDWLTIPGAALLRYGSSPPAAAGGPACLPSPTQPS